MFGCFRFYVQSLRKTCRNYAATGCFSFTVTAGPGCERLVRFVILVIEFSRAWGVSCSFVVYLGLFAVIGTVSCIGLYCYC